MEENDDHNVIHSPTEVKQTLPVATFKDTASNLANGPEDSISMEDVQDLKGQKTIDSKDVAPAQNSQVELDERVVKEQAHSGNKDTSDSLSSSASQAETSLANSELTNRLGAGSSSEHGGVSVKEGSVESIGHDPNDDDKQNVQTSYVNESALVSTGISSQADRELRDCDSSLEQLGDGGKDEQRLGKQLERATDSDGEVQGNEGLKLHHNRREADVVADQRTGNGNLDQEQGPGLDQNQDQEQNDDRNLEQFSEILLDSDLSESDDAVGEEETGMRENGSVEAAEATATSKKTKRVRFADEVAGANGVSHGHRSPPPGPSSFPDLSPSHASIPMTPPPTSPKQKGPPVPQFSMTELINGVEMPAEYLGSTPIILGGTGTIKAARMYQAQQAVQLVKDPDNESRPRFAVNVKISTAAIVLADRATGLDLMEHPLHTITYVADIDRVLVIMAHVLPTPVTSPSAPSGEAESPNSNPLPSDGQNRAVTGTYTPKLTCHVLDAPNARSIAMVIGQAFSAAYKQALRASGVTEEQLEQAEYNHILNAQTMPKLEVESLGDRNKTKKLTIPKHKNDIMGVMVMESGYGSAIPAPVIVHLSKTGSAARSGQLNVGDHILSINGVNLVGMPRKTCIEQIKKCRQLNVVRIEVCSCPAVVDVTIVRPDLKFQLGFTVHEGMICSLMRGSIAERSGIRVGHRIIEINGTSTVGMQHSETVHLLSSTVGDLHIRTMSDVMYKLLTGQLQPEYY